MASLTRQYAQIAGSAVLVLLLCLAWVPGMQSGGTHCKETMPDVAKQSRLKAAFLHMIC